MKRTILLSLSLLAFILIPGMAAAAETAPAAPQGCSDLSFLGAAPLTPALALDPIAGAIQTQGGGCCAGKQQQCQSRCACGVFEFNCDPATCQSSCICNICP
ncbi:MAG TPA: hypothetical protein VF414_11405 [Thermoanaerobaculia bacterium]